MRRKTNCSTKVLKALGTRSPFIHLQIGETNKELGVTNDWIECDCLLELLDGIAQIERLSVSITCSHMPNRCISGPSNDLPEDAVGLLLFVVGEQSRAKSVCHIDFGIDFKRTTKGIDGPLFIVYRPQNATSYCPRRGVAGFHA